MPKRDSRARELLVRAGYRLGWRVAARVPARVHRALPAIGGRWAVRRGGKPLQLLARNLAIAADREVDDDLLRAAVASYLRTVLEVLALPGWSAQEILGRVRTTNEHVLREAAAATGAVVALPHSGNWDLAGAWACTTGMPVTTVAEQLPEADFADFLRFRRRLGMEIFSHADPVTLPSLAQAIRRGRLVCLVADRDLSGGGVPVSWAGHPIRMPAGPALVARRTGAALVPAVCAYRGSGMLISFADPVLAVPGRAGLVQMTQQVADFFAAQISRQPEDWHMFQPFFGSPPSPGTGRTTRTSR